MVLKFVVLVVWLTACCCVTMTAATRSAYDYDDEAIDEDVPVRTFKHRGPTPHRQPVPPPPPPPPHRDPLFDPREELTVKEYRVYRRSVQLPDDYSLLLPPSSKRLRTEATPPITDDNVVTVIEDKEQNTVTVCSADIVRKQDLEWIAQEAAVQGDRPLSISEIVNDADVLAHEPFSWPAPAGPVAAAGGDDGEEDEDEEDDEQQARDEAEGEDAAAAEAAVPESMKQLAKALYAEFDAKVFDGKLARHRLPIRWSSRMSRAAGMYNPNPGKRAITLASKLLTVKERLRKTLLHEMCHAATDILDDASRREKPHGPTWKKWAAKGNRIYGDPGLVTQCHTYDMTHSKWQFKCQQCQRISGTSNKARREKLALGKSFCGICYAKWRKTHGNGRKPMPRDLPVLLPFFPDDK
jgi:predicted SprT family Zn-dependent metalloprotease